LITRYFPDELNADSWHSFIVNMQTWTGQALASAGPDWKYFYGAALCSVCTYLFRGTSSRNDRSQWCEKPRPRAKWWPRDMDDVPVHHLAVLFCSETKTVLSLSFLAKSLLCLWAVLFGSN